MTRRMAAAALSFDLDAFDDVSMAQASSAMVRGRDGRLLAVDMARLAWPDERAAAGVDFMAELDRRGPLGRC